MKLTILESFARSTAVFIATTIEFLFRMAFFLMPVGLYYLVLQLRAHATPAAVLTETYLNSESTWMHIAPDTILVCKEGKDMQKAIKLFNLPRKIQILVGFVRTLAYLGMVMTCAVILYFILFKGGF